MTFLDILYLIEPSSEVAVAAGLSRVITCINHGRPKLTYFHQNKINLSIRLDKVFIIACTNGMQTGKLLFYFSLLALIDWIIL